MCLRASYSHVSPERASPACACTCPSSRVCWVSRPFLAQRMCIGKCLINVVKAQADCTPGFLVHCCVLLESVTRPKTSSALSLLSIPLACRYPFLPGLVVCHVPVLLGALQPHLHRERVCPLPQACVSIALPRQATSVLSVATCCCSRCSAVACSAAPRCLQNVVLFTGQQWEPG